MGLSSLSLIHLSAPTAQFAALFPIVKVFAGWVFRTLIDVACMVTVLKFENPQE